jgi:hypothetical protein
VKSIEECSNLTCQIEDEDLVIRIGIPLLMHALQEGPDWTDEFRVTDPMAFAKAIAFHLQNDEEEDGSTSIHRALDAAATHAIESACEGVEDSTLEGMEDDE